MDRISYIYSLQSTTNRRTAHHLVSMVRLSFKADLVPEIQWLLVVLNLSVGDLVTTNSRFRCNSRHLSRVTMLILDLLDLHLRSQVLLRNLWVWRPDNRRCSLPTMLLLPNKDLYPNSPNLNRSPSSPNHR